MPKSEIAFSNLRAEMSRRNIEVKDIAAAIHVGVGTAGSKLARKSPLKLNEAFEIRQSFFPDKDIPYLFAELVPPTPSTPRNPAA